MSFSQLFQLLACIILIAFNGKIDASLQGFLGIWRFAISIPLSVISVFLVYSWTPLLVPMTLVIVIMLLSVNYIKYRG
jgi:hypothetical protein